MYMKTLIYCFATLSLPCALAGKSSDNSFLKQNSELTSALTSASHRRMAQELWRKRNTRARSEEALGVEAQSGSRLANQPSEVFVENFQPSSDGVKSSLSETDIKSLTKRVTKEAYDQELHNFVDSFDSRFVGSDKNSDVAKTIKGKFTNLGLKTEIQDLSTNELSRFLHASTPGGNVVATLPGTDKKHEIILLGAHYDSVNWKDTGGKAPGVDDNGSGSALVMLAAKALTEFAKTHPPRRTIMFVAFNGEEEGLIGSEQFASKAVTDDFKKNVGDIKNVIIADEVAWAGSGQTANKAIFETKGDVQGTSSLLDTFAHAEAFEGGDGIKGFDVNTDGFGSDHMSFLNRGIPAVLLIERDDMYHADTWGHSAEDTFEHVDSGYGASMSRLALRSLAPLAWPSDGEEVQTA